MANDLIETESTAIAVRELNEKYDVIESDLNELQSGITAVNEKIQDQISTLIEFSDASQHPKVYEALAKVVSSYSSLIRESSNIIKQKKELFDDRRQGIEPKESQPKVVDNRSIHFNGTANELLDMIHNKKDQK